MHNQLRITATLQYECDPGRRYPNAIEALQMIKALRLRRGWKWVCQACPRCAGWHLFEKPWEVSDRG